MTLETEQEYKKRRRSHEGREAGAEEKESKEIDEDLKAAAAMERADVLVREVKSGKKQIQNILIHMQHVVAALRDLRTELQLTHRDEDASVTQDKARVEQLKKRIQEYKAELISMKDDLIREQMAFLREQTRTKAGDEGVRREAERQVEEIMREAGID